MADHHFTDGDAYGSKHESVDLAKYMVMSPVDRPGFHSLVYSLTYGHPIKSPALQEARVDVAVNYDNVSNDAKKKDRFVASVTCWAKIRANMSARPPGASDTMIFTGFDG